MSEFVYLFRIGAAQQREAMGTPEHAQQSMKVWLAWMRELETSGHLKNPGQPLEPEDKVVRGKRPRSPPRTPARRVWTRRLGKRSSRSTIA